MKLAFVLLLAAAVAVMHADADLLGMNRKEVKELFSVWKTKFDVSYPTAAAEIKAMRIWRKTVIRVAKHNLRESLGLETYTQAVNSFAAHSEEDFSNMHGLIMDGPQPL